MGKSKSSNAAPYRWYEGTGLILRIVPPQPRQRNPSYIQISHHVVNQWVMILPVLLSGLND